MERYLEFRIDEQTTELKMEAFLKKNAGLTKRQISQAKFRPDGITRNGVRCRVTETIYPGDVIRVCLEEAGTASAHPTGMHYTDSLSNLVASYFREKNEQVCVRPVGRLDQETSGIVVFAQNQVAASRLQSVKSPCKIHKQYLAAVSGTLPVDMPGVWHTLDLPLMQDPENHLKMKTAADLSLHSSALSGKIKTAVTHYHTLFSSQDWSLITLKLDTGRTHQIRVHMASTGHPLLGDTLYNSDDKISSCASFSRAALHAWKVSFQHPFRDEMLLLEAPLPFDFRELVSLSGSDLLSI